MHGSLHLRNVKERKKEGNRKINNFPIPKPTTGLNTYKAPPLAWNHRPPESKWMAPAGLPLLCLTPPSPPCFIQTLLSLFLPFRVTSPSTHLSPGIQHLGKYLRNNFLETHNHNIFKNIVQIDSKSIGFIYACGYIGVGVDMCMTTVGKQSKINLLLLWLRVFICKSKIIMYK